MVQEALKNATSGDHKKLEALMYVKDLAEGTLTLDQYIHLIYTNYRVHQLAEQKLFDWLRDETKAKLNITKREKLSALRKDMDTLGMDSDTMMNTLPAFEIGSEAAALGALYVLEGATLGGQVILRMLQKNNAANHLQSAFNYYNVYGDNLGKNWKAFCSVINQLPVEDIQEAIAGSKTMYAFFRKVHTSGALAAFTAPEAH